MSFEFLGGERERGWGWWGGVAGRVVRGDFFYFLSCFFAVGDACVCLCLCNGILGMYYVFKIT